MIVTAYAKINLTLDVLDKRPDGYHNISSVMQTIAHSDVLDIALTDSPNVIELTVDGDSPSHDIPTNETNLAHRAAAAILGATQRRRGARIHLRKNIAIRAGLGGGSSDSAATLIAINRLLGDPLKISDLAKLAFGLGSDVSFFLTGGTCLVEGAGEAVTALPDIAPRELLIAIPESGVPTNEAYAALDRRREGRNLAHRAPWDGRSLRNDFQEVAEALCPEVASAMRALIDAGCREVQLCGSGSAVFGFLPHSGAGQRPSDTAPEITAREMPSGPVIRWVKTRTATRSESTIP